MCVYCGGGGVCVEGLPPPSTSFLVINPSIIQPLPTINELYLHFQSKYFPPLSPPHNLDLMADSLIVTLLVS